MKIIVAHAADTPIESAHGGTGSRRLYIDDKQSPSGNIQGMTHGWLPAGEVFDWHTHEDIEEVMFVMKGSGIVADREGEYAYSPGTVVVFPANVEHTVINNTQEEHEFMFVRIYE